MDFIEDGDLESGWNPARPHSLRAAFNSRLTGKMDRTIIEFFMGHAVDEEKLAYLRMPDDELRELYANYEHLLTVERTSRQELEGVEAIDEKTEKRINELEVTIEGLAGQLKKRSGEVESLKSEVLELQQEIEPMRAWFEELRRRQRSLGRRIDLET